MSIIIESPYKFPTATKSYDCCSSVCRRCVSLRCLLPSTEVRTTRVTREVGLVEWGSPN